MSITNEQVIEHISSMTVLDLANLVKELETKFEVFPGQIKVTVLREYRAEAVAKYN